MKTYKEFTTRSSKQYKKFSQDENCSNLNTIVETHSQLQIVDDHEGEIASPQRYSSTACFFLVSLGVGAWGIEGVVH